LLEVLLGERERLNRFSLARRISDSEERGIHRSAWLEQTAVRE
jgi:hypothetical protein